LSLRAILLSLREILTVIASAAKQSHTPFSLKGRALKEKGGRPFNPLYLARDVRVK